MHTTDKGIIVPKENEDRVMLLGQSMRSIIDEQIQNVMTQDLGEFLPKVDGKRDDNTYRYFFSDATATVDPIRRYKPLKRGQCVPSLAVQNLRKNWEAFAARKNDRIINAHALQLMDSLRFPDPEEAAERYLLGGWPWNRRLAVLWASVPLGTAKLPPSEGISRLRTIPQWLVAGQWICIAVFIILASVLAVVEGPPWLKRQILLSQWNQDQAKAEELAQKSKTNAADLLRQLHSYQSELRAAGDSASLLRGKLKDEDLKKAQAVDLQQWLAASKKHDAKRQQLAAQLATIRTRIQALPTDSLNQMNDYLRKENMDELDPARAEIMGDIAREADTEVTKTITALSNTSDTALDMLASSVQTNTKTVEAEMDKRRNDVPTAIRMVTGSITGFSSKVDVLKATVDGFVLRAPESMKEQLLELDADPKTKTVWSSYPDELAAIKQEIKNLESQAAANPEHMKQLTELTVLLNDVAGRYDSLKLLPAQSTSPLLPAPDSPAPTLQPARSDPSTNKSKKGSSE